MSMDHDQAQSTKAAERYLLGEMSEPERFEFESHYFECEECAGDVRAVHALANGIKAVCAEEPEPVRVHAASRAWWPRWLMPALAGGLAAMAGYQGLVLIPGLRSQTESRAMAPIVLRAAARGEEQVLELSKDQPYALVSLDVNNADPGAPLTYQVVAPGGEVRLSNPAQAPPLGSPLIVVLSKRDLVRPGSWMLVLRDSKGAEISRYPFSVPK
jgi:hypothetical protein